MFPVRRKHRRGALSEGLNLRTVRDLVATIRARVMPERPTNESRRAPTGVPRQEELQVRNARRALKGRLVDRATATLALRENPARIESPVTKVRHGALRQLGGRRRERRDHRGTAKPARRRHLLPSSASDKRPAIAPVKKGGGASLVRAQ